MFIVNYFYVLFCPFTIKFKYYHNIKNAEPNLTSQYGLV